MTDNSWLADRKRGKVDFGGGQDARPIAHRNQRQVELAPVDKLLGKARLPQLPRARCNLVANGRAVALANEGVIVETDGGVFPDRLDDVGRRERRAGAIGRNGPVGSWQ